MSFSAGGASVCSPCSPGQYSITNASLSCIPCSTGKFSPDVGRNSSCVVDCPAGRACRPAGTSNPSPCAAGLYGVNCNSVCPAGSYCEQGAAVPVPCPAGRFGASDGLPSSTCTGDCPAGYYCGNGTVAPLVCGNASVYCPGGSSSPSLVPPGSYSTPEAGNASLRSGVAQCQSGEYCVAGSGVRLPCSGGTYSADVGRTIPCDTSCPAGTLKNVEYRGHGLLRSCSVRACCA